MALTDRTVCLSLTLTRFGTSRKVPKGAITVDADKELISGAKKLLDGPEVEAIQAADGALGRWIKAQAVPAPLFRTGVHCIPLDSVGEVDARLTAYETVERPKLVQALIDAYPALKDRDQERLRSIFDPTEYPPSAALRACFRVVYAWVAFDTPSQLTAVSPALVDRERTKLAERFQEAENEIQFALREALDRLVGHLLERLRGDGDGRPKKFHDSTVENLEAFLDGFARRNVTDDAALAKLVEQAKAVLAGVKPDELRRSWRLREIVVDRFTEIEAALEPLVAERPRRFIELED